MANDDQACGCARRRTVKLLRVQLQRGFCVEAKVDSIEQGRFLQE